LIELYYDVLCNFFKSFRYPPIILCKYLVIIVMRIANESLLIL